jgi:hypothetical protein
MPSMQEQLQSLPRLKHLQVWCITEYGRPDLAVGLLQCLPLTLQSFQYEFSGRFGSILLERRQVEAYVPAHMRLTEWLVTDPPDNTRHEFVLRLHCVPIGLQYI